jgi:DnaK suppressor protein
MHDQFVALRRHRMGRRKLKLIDAALERLDRGEFGICEECGEAIPLKRLEAIPWAACCVPCQERLGDDDYAEKYELCESTG